MIIKYSDGAINAVVKTAENSDELLKFKEESEKNKKKSEESSKDEHNES